MRFYSHIWWPLYQTGIPDFDAMGFQGYPERHFAPKQIHTRSIYLYAKNILMGKRFASAQMSYVESLMPSVMVPGDGACGNNRSQTRGHRSGFVVALVPL